MRVVLAPNAFKGSLTATQVATAMAMGVRSVLPAADIVTVPIADGGDGSIDALVLAGFEALAIEVRGPTGLPVSTTMARSGTTVVVELANTCGQLLLPGGRPAPLHSSTAGLGDAVRAALDAGAARIALCLGGSASTDGGTGLLVALGAVLRDADGAALEPCGASLPRIAALDLTRLDPRTGPTRITIASDVTSPLLGDTGAAAMFAPQKGATDEQVAFLERGLRHWAGVVRAATGRNDAAASGAGAAGGTGLAAISVLGATVTAGATFIAEAVHLRAQVEGANLVVTGEGSLDRQSLLGKGALAVVRLGLQCGVDAVLVCGSIGLDADELTAQGAGAWAALDALSTEPMTRAAELVAVATAEVVERWVTRPV